MSADQVTVFAAFRLSRKMPWLYDLGKKSSAWWLMAAAWGLFDGHSAAYLRSLRSQWHNTDCWSANCSKTDMFIYTCLSAAAHTQISLQSWCQVVIVVSCSWMGVERWSNRSGNHHVSQKHQKLSIGTCGKNVFCAVRLLPLLTVVVNVKLIIACCSYQFYIHIKADIVDGRLLCNSDQAVLFAAYAAQGLLFIVFFWSFWLCILLILVYYVHYLDAFIAVISVRYLDSFIAVKFL